MTTQFVGVAGVSRRLFGILLMIVAMLIVPIVDGLAKYLSAAYSPLLIGWMRYFVSGLIVVPVALAVRGRRFWPSERLGAHCLRTVFLVGAMTLYFLAIARIPLATAASAFFIGPILGVLLSALILKEPLTPRKLVSLALGCIGSIVILRPGAAIDVDILLALGSGLCFALYLITTRQAASGSDPLATLAFQCCLGALLLAPQAAITWTMPGASAWLLFAILGGVSALSHFLSISAFRYADASTLSPYVYVELIGIAIVGYVGFREVPDMPTILGASLIVVAGLILALEPRRIT